MIVFQMKISVNQNNAVAKISAGCDNDAASNLLNREELFTELFRRRIYLNGNCCVLPTSFLYHMKTSDVTISDGELRVLLETGYILREAARFAEAEAIFRGVIELMPDSEVPQVGLGTVFLQMGDFSAAQNACEQALRIQPASLYARVHYAEALLFGKHREQAETELRKIIKTAPDSPHSQTAQALLDAADLIAPQ